MEVTTCIEICAGHRLLKYSGACGHPHGHNYRIEVTVDGVPDRLGMVIDFKELRKMLHTITKPLDHAMLLREDDPLLPALALEPHTILNVNPTAESIASLIFNHLQDAGLRVQRVRVQETENSYAVAIRVDRSVRVVRSVS